MATYSTDSLNAGRLRCDGCGQLTAAVPGPGGADAACLTAAEVVRRFPRLADEVSLHELVCGRNARRRFSGSAPDCLACRQRAARCRGCCPPCYHRHLRAVARGDTTWPELERRGQAAAPRRRTGPGGAAGVRR
jgi:hypothetical protein